MRDIRSAIVRVETVRLVDAILEGLIQRRLDRVALRKLPPWRAHVLAQIAHRVGAMPDWELDAFTAEVVKVGADGVLKQLPEPPPLPTPPPRPPTLRIPKPPPAPADAPKWTQRGMIQHDRRRRQTGSRHPSR